jgi:hypothetical protein
MHLLPASASASPTSRQSNHSSLQHGRLIRKDATVFGILENVVSKGIWSLPMKDMMKWRESY